MGRLEENLASTEIVLTTAELETLTSAANDIKITGARGSGRENYG